MTKPSARTEQALRRALLASKVRVRVEAPLGVAIDTARFSPGWESAGDGGRGRLGADRGQRDGEVLQTLDTSAAFNSDIGFSPDGERVVTADSNGDVTVWSLDDGRRITTVHVTDSPLQSASYSPDGKLIAAGAQSGYAAVFDASGGDRQSAAGSEGPRQLGRVLSRLEHCSDRLQ